MPEVEVRDATLHVEVDGEGEPVTVMAHGITNSCRELVAFTPLMPGTKVRFCFRGHGHSSSPEKGYRFADFARDVEAVADAYGARYAWGTSLGASAIATLLSDKPDRFDKNIWLLPAGLDVPFQYKDRMLRTVDLIEGKSKEEAIDALLSDPDRLAGYLDLPMWREMDRQLLQELNPEGVARAIREVIEDWPLRDREDMRKVTAPTLMICRRGDVIHPAEVGEVLAEIMPNAELMMFDDGVAMFQAIPQIVAKVQDFLRS